MLPISDPQSLSGVATYQGAPQQPTDSTTRSLEQSLYVFVATSPDGPQDIRMARRTQPQGLGAPDQGAARDFPGVGAHPCARAAVHPADAPACRRRLLARAPGPPRAPGARAGGEKRRAGGLDLAAREGRAARSAEELPLPAGALSRARVRARPGLLLRLRPAGVPARLARRSVGRGHEPQRDPARSLRDRLAVLERPQRPGTAAQAPAGARPSAQRQTP